MLLSWKDSFHKPAYLKKGGIYHMCIMYTLRRTWIFFTEKYVQMFFEVKHIVHMLNYQILKIYGRRAYFDVPDIYEFPACKASTNRQVHVFYSRSVIPSSSIMDGRNPPYTSSPCKQLILILLMFFPSNHLWYDI